MLINGAWYIDSMPQHFVIEVSDGSLKLATLAPFRDVSMEVTDYKGHHPRRLKGNPIPQYLYRFYGLEKNTEGLTEVIHVRCTPTEKEKAQTEADSQNKTASELIRDYLRSL